MTVKAALKESFPDISRGVLFPHITMYLDETDLTSTLLNTGYNSFQENSDCDFYTTYFRLN